jgi:hypothetical protein
MGHVPELTPVEVLDGFGDFILRVHYERPAALFTHSPDLNDNGRTIRPMKSVCKWTHESAFVFSSTACA